MVVPFPWGHQLSPWQGMGLLCDVCVRLVFFDYINTCYLVGRLDWVRLPCVEPETLCWPRLYFYGCLYSPVWTGWVKIFSHKVLHTSCLPTSSARRQTVVLSTFAQKNFLNKVLDVIFRWRYHGTYSVWCWIRLYAPFDRTDHLIHWITVLRMILWCVFYTHIFHVYSSDHRTLVDLLMRIFFAFVPQLHCRVSHAWCRVCHARSVYDRILIACEDMFSHSTVGSQIRRMAYTSLHTYGNSGFIRARVGVSACRGPKARRGLCTWLLLQMRYVVYCFLPAWFSWCSGMHTLCPLSRAGDRPFGW